LRLCWRWRGMWPSRKAKEPVEEKRPGNVKSVLLVPVARVALWLAVAVVLFHGLGDILGPEVEPSVTRANVAEWPDDQARAFAEQFVTALLTIDPDDEAPERRVDRFLADGLPASEVAAVPKDAEQQWVRSTAVADVRAVDGEVGVVTVAADVGFRRPDYVAVRVARDAAGGLAVADFPAFVAAPPRTGVRWNEPERLEDSPLERHVEQFLTAYLGGSDELAYLAVPGSRIGRPARTLVDVRVEGVYPVGSQRGTRRTVAAAVVAEDAATGAEWRLRYELVVERRDRWLVAEIDG
jgi:hypothetical protein